MIQPATVQIGEFPAAEGPSSALSPLVHVAIRPRYHPRQSTNAYSGQTGVIRAADPVPPPPPTLSKARILLRHQRTSGKGAMSLLTSGGASHRLLTDGGSDHGSPPTPK